MLTNLGILVGVVVAISGLLGTAIAFLVKYALIPYIEKRLVKPVRETHKQVTQNHHTSDPPTIPDRIENMMHTINTRLDDVEGEVATMIGIIVRMSNAVEHINRKVSK